MGKHDQRKFNNEFKARVAIEAIKGRKTLSELCGEFELHTTQICNWKKQAVDGLKDIFDNKKNVINNSQENKIDELYRQIGKLQVENDFLKKNVYRN